jgi:WD40 repeat protein
MKIILKWQLNKDNLPINACAIDPVHDQMIIAVGKSIIVLDVINGNEIRKCEKHTQDVTCLAYRKDGLWFASGG